MGQLTSLRVRRTEWEKFAKRNAYYYICTELRKSDTGTFWQSGEETAEQELLPVAVRYGAPRGTALEIGCGAGRLALPMAQHFGRVVGLDIAAGMVSLARENATERGVENVNFMTIGEVGRLGAELDALQRSVDFVYSLLVFQHIDDFRVIDAYLRMIAELLSPAGVGYLQFDTRSKDPLYYVKGMIPDLLLRENWRRGIRRIRREPEELERCFAKNGLVVEESIAPRTALHRYVIRTSGRS